MTHDRQNPLMKATTYYNPENWPIRGKAPEPGDGTDEIARERHQSWIDSDPDIGEVADKLSAETKRQVAEKGCVHGTELSGTVEMVPGEWYIDPMTSVNGTPFGAVKGTPYWRKGTLKEYYEANLNKDGTANILFDVDKFYSVELFADMNPVIHVHRTVIRELTVEAFEQAGFVLKMLPASDDTVLNDAALGLFILLSPGTRAIDSVIFVAPGYNAHDVLNVPD